MTVKEMEELKAKWLGYAEALVAKEDYFEAGKAYYTVAYYSDVIKAVRARD